jgi:hypothetical protein
VCRRLAFPSPPPTPPCRHQGFEERLAAYFGPSLTPAHLKLADLPEGQVELVDVTLEGGATSPFPLVKCNNIFVLPGEGLAGLVDSAGQQS